MFQFEDISYLYLLLLVPLVIVLYYLVEKSLLKKLYRQVNKTLADRLIKGRNTSRNLLKLILLSVAMVLISIAATNPQWGYKDEVVKAESSEVFIALDISNSMLAQDISPNRLEKSKRFIQKLIKNLKGDQVGLILFAGQAYLQTPLTLDLATVELFIRSAGTKLAGTQGTNIAQAIQFAQNSFTDDNEYKKALIIITDGENHDQEAIDQAKLAAEDGILIFSIGVGTSDGAFIPDVNSNSGYKKDNEGNPVRSRLDMNLINNIATAGQGKSYSLDKEKEALSSINREIEKLAKKETKQKSFKEFKSYFQYFLFGAVLLLLLELILSRRKVAKLS